MSLFDSVQKTPAQLKYEDVSKKLPQLLQGEKNRCLAIYNDFWGSKENPISREEATELLALFGTSAADVFKFHSNWQGFILSIDPTWEILVPPYEIKINENGTAELVSEPTN